MAKIGIMNPTYAPITGEPANAAVVYGPGKTFAHAINAGISYKRSDTELRGDNVVIESDNSITSGEGVRGPRSFMEWLPMCFGASDNYTRLTAEKLHADYHVVSQSGWGVLCGWNNDPRTALPAVYDSVCGPAAMEASAGDAHGGEKPYAFDFDPDTIVVNLGTNDSNALTQPAFPVPGTGETYRFTQADIPTFEDACLRFLLHLQQKNPHARILWAYGIAGDTLAAPIAAAVQRAAEQGVPVEFLALPNTDSIRGGMGSREHPGPAAHRRMAALLAARLR